jgi:hypothetical protein
MWALVEDGNVIEVYNYPKSIVLNDVRYPPNMFTLYTEDEKKQIGIYNVQLKEEPDNRFYRRGEYSFSYDSEKEIVNEDFPVIDKTLEDEETTTKDDHGNFTIIEGLKTQFKNACKTESYLIIKRYQWLVERFIYDNTKTIPSNITTYVGNVRSSCETMCTAIENCSNIDELKVLFKDTLNEAGEVTEVAVMNNWPDDYSIRKDIR